MTIEVVEKPTENDYHLFRNFADQHEGEDPHFSKEEVGLYFFAKAKKIILAKIDNKIVGAANVGIREITFGGEKIVTGTLGGVVTHVDYRRKGIATEVVKKAKEIMRKNKVDVAILCTDIPKLGPLYNQVGFVPLDRSYFFIDKNCQKQSGQGGMIAPVNSKSKFEKILNSLEELNVGLSNF